MANFTITYVAKYPTVYPDGFDGITIPAIFTGRNAYIDSETYDAEAFSSYDTNNYGIGIDWDDVFENFKAQSIHPGIARAMQKAYVGAYEAAKLAVDTAADVEAGDVAEYPVATATYDSESATGTGTNVYTFDVTGLTGEQVAFYKDAVASVAGYTVADAE